MDIAECLETTGLGQYAQRFAENDIDLDALRQLTDEDLEKLGVSLGHRRKLVAAMAALGRTPDDVPTKSLGPSRPTDTAIKDRPNIQVVISENTIRSDAPYASLFQAAKVAGVTVGGKLKNENRDTGFLQFKFKYGINLFGIRVDIQIRRADDGMSEVSVHGHFVDAIDTTGAAQAKGRLVLNELVKRIENGPLTTATFGPSGPTSAPILGEADVAHRGKSKAMVALLALLLGGAGIHRSYLGTWGWAIVYLVLNLISWGVIGTLLGAVDAVRFFLMKPANFDAKFNYSRVGAFTF